MTTNRFNQLGRLFILLAALLEFSPGARAESLASIFTNVAPAATTAIPRRASIIFIQCDGLGYGDLSCYGQTKFQTPNLDKLAADGIRFTSYYAGDAAASPSRAALMTGRDASHLRQRADVDIALAPDQINVAQLLKNSGYHTGLIGEWGLGDAPWTQGFDEFAGFIHSDEAQNYYSDYVWRYAPDALLNETENHASDYTGKEEIYPNTGGQRGEYIPDLFTFAAVSFVKNNQPDRFNHYRPFFLLVNYPTPRPDTTGTNSFPVPTDAPYSDENWPQPAKNRAAMITRLDGDIGRLLDQLKTIGMTNNVAIFFSSVSVPQKAGGFDPEFFQSNVSSNDLRVPMIVRWPDKINAGQVSNFKWSARDFLPTAAEIAFAKSPPAIDGVSILPTLLGGRLKPAGRVFENKPAPGQ
jgi:arylsulfatase A-like enzyme